MLRLRPSDPRLAGYLENPRLQVVPSKFVFTVKPPDQGQAAVRDAVTAKVLPQAEAKGSSQHAQVKVKSPSKEEAVPTQALFRRKARLV